MPRLIIRNKGLAIFTELKLKQKPKVLADGFEFETDQQIAALKYEYANSLEQKVFELNMAYSQAQSRIRKTQ